MAGILEDGPLRRILRGQTSDIDWRDEAEGTVESQVTRAIAKEKEAIDDYAELEHKLRRVGLNGEADIVKEIRNDELDHREKFQRMLERMQVHH